ncbi:hypothetical protein F5X96DRAFT_287542 [Biscogniauxia mediterranea]|nr:hypothetical protein F5X96DRAFT_287542 [Biscogniauxia mediterranea]
MWPRKPSAYQICRSSTGTLEGALDNSARPLPRAQPQPVFPVSLTWSTGLPVIDMSCPRPHQSIWPAACIPPPNHSLALHPRGKLIATHEERQYKSKTERQKKLLHRLMVSDLWLIEIGSMSGAQPAVQLSIDMYSHPKEDRAGCNLLCHLDPLFLFFLIYPGLLSLL